jgi:hypothetical protein
MDAPGAWVRAGANKETDTAQAAGTAVRRDEKAAKQGMIGARIDRHKET